MTDADAVTEVIADATVTVEVPIERGDELAAGATDALEAVPVVRYAGVETVGEVDAGEDGLAVAVGCRLTFHVDERLATVGEVRDRLAAAPDVHAVEDFDAIDGPYRVAAW